MTQDVSVLQHLKDTQVLLTLCMYDAHKAKDSALLRRLIDQANANAIAITLEKHAPQPLLDEAAAWLIEWTGEDSIQRRCVGLHNSIGDVRNAYPNATSTPLFPAAKEWA